jgi:hypothetical protein
MLNRIYGVLLLTLLILALISSCNDDNAQAVNASEGTATATAEKTTTLPDTI